jgi:putative ABC transport system permease protein
MRLRALAWRGLAARPLRTLLTAAGVALGIAIVAATLIASQAATEAVRRAAQELLGSAELRVRAFSDEGFTPRTVTALRQIPGVLNAAAVSERRGLTFHTPPDPVEEKVLTVSVVLGVDPADEARIRTYDLVAGSVLDPDQPKGMLVGAALAEAFGLQVGDELRLDARRQGVPGNVIVGLLTDSGTGALASGSVAILQRDFLASAFEVPAPIRYVDLQVAEGRAADVQTALDDTLSEPFVVETVGDAEEQFARAQAGFAGLAFLLGLVALAVGSFLVANTLAMTLTEQTREIGLLRAAGTTSRQVLALFIRQGAIVALIGGISGLVLGVALAEVVIGFLRSTRAVLVAGIPFHPGALALAFVLGAGVTMAGAALPAVAASRVSPLDALRPSRQPARSLAGRLPWLIGLVSLTLVIGFVAYPLQRGDADPSGFLPVLGLLLSGTLLVAIALQPLAALIGRPFEWFFGAEGMLGRANLARDRVRTGLTVGALVMGLASVVALGAVSASARATADRWVGSILPGGYAIRMGIPNEIEVMRPTFEGIAGVETATPILELPVVVVDDEGQREASIAGIDPTVFQDNDSLIIVEGRRSTAFQALRDGGAVLVPEPVARRDGLSVGDTMLLAQPGADAQAFRVAGVVAYSLPTRGPDGALLVSLADAQDRFGVTQASLWALVPQDGVSPEAFSRQVAAVAKQQAAIPLTAADLADELGRSLDRLIGLFDVLALLAVVIGSLGIVNTLAMGVVERGREIAILRSHGMTVGQVQAMVVSEAAIMGAVGGVAAVATGLLVAWATVTFGAPGDFAAGLAIPWSLLAAVILLGIGVASAAGIYPARLAARASITDSLEHFE